MNLQNGCYYRTATGKAVHCQIESDGMFHIYDIHGATVDKIEPTTEHQQALTDSEGKEKETTIQSPTHVEGWKPIGKAEFDKDKVRARNAKEKAKGKGKNKEDKPADKKPETKE